MFAYGLGDAATDINIGKQSILGQSVKAKLCMGLARQRVGKARLKHPWRQENEGGIFKDDLIYALV